MKRILYVDENELQRGHRPLPVPISPDGKTRWVQEVWPWDSGRMITGDYTIKGFEDRLRIERKMAPDEILKCLTTDLVRFKKQLDRLGEFDHPTLLVEGVMTSYLSFDPACSKRRWATDIPTVRGKQLGALEVALARKGITPVWIGARSKTESSEMRTARVVGSVLDGIIERINQCQQT